MADNPALYYAGKHGYPVIPLFIWAPLEEGEWAPGGAHKWWLHHSLHCMAQSLARCGAPLVIRKGESLDNLEQIISLSGARAVYWNTRYEPESSRTDEAIATRLRASGIEVRTFAGELLHQPDLVKTGAGAPYQVFTPFWKKLRASLKVSDPLPGPEGLCTYDDIESLETVSIESLELLPRIDWAAGLREAWKPGEKAAHERLHLFIDSILPAYSTKRDFPAVDGTSRLSPYLHFGEISPRQVWHAVSEKMCEKGMREDGDCFLREIAWREFSYHLLHHFPHTSLENLKPAFDGLSWEDNDRWLQRWQKGETGYPIVDAGMRQLWTTGWMHNRVRMIVASFLTKHLLIHWRYGARWFWDTLVDGNLANNTMGWQWSAGSGADAQPFFRIFNPITQSRRFDPDGAYIKRWVPELHHLPTRYLHEPWTLSDSDQVSTGFTPGKSYPLPLVDHKIARERALDAYRKIRS